MVNGETMLYNVDKEEPREVQEILAAVLKALQEKGYDPINQIVGYILSGDPTYITNHQNARGIIRRVERDELLEELVKYYIHHKKSMNDNGAK